MENKINYSFSFLTGTSKIKVELERLINRMTCEYVYSDNIHCDFVDVFVKYICPTVYHSLFMNLDLTIGPMLNQG